MWHDDDLRVVGHNGGPSFRFENKAIHDHDDDVELRKETTSTTC